MDTQPPPPSAGAPSLRSLAGLAAVVLGAWAISQAVSWWQDARAAQAVREGSQRGDITLYTTSTCPYCARAAAWLNKHGVRWRECNIETDTTCLRTYEAQGAPGVPLVQVNGQWDLGFNANWVAEALRTPAAGTPRGTPPPQADRPSGASSPRP